MDEILYSSKVKHVFKIVAEKAQMAKAVPNRIRVPVHGCFNKVTNLSTDVHENTSH